MPRLSAHLAVCGVALLSAGACRAPTAVPAACAAGQLCVRGTIRFVSLEGGFWAIRGDNRVSYDPVGGLPTAFQKEGLRVYLVARERLDMGSVHMSGSIVDIVSIQRLF